MYSYIYRSLFVIFCALTQTHCLCLYITYTHRYISFYSHTHWHTHAHIHGYMNNLGCICKTFSYIYTSTYVRTCICLCVCLWMYWYAKCSRPLTRIVNYHYIFVSTFCYLSLRDYPCICIHTRKQTHMHKSTYTHIY